MTKPREFWIEETKRMAGVRLSVSTAPVPESIHVREVLPIPWERVWAELNEWQDERYKIGDTMNTDKLYKQIQDLVERALKGEL